MRYAFGDLVEDVARPFIIGILIAGLISFCLPDDLSRWTGGHRFLTMMVMLAAGIPMYVCATSSTPIAASLILKGLSPGAALVFLLAGPATNAATMTIVKNLFSTRALIIYLSMIAVCSVGMGLFLDWLYLISGIQPAVSIGSSPHIIPFYLKLISAAVLGSLMISSMIKKERSDHTHPA